jgi:hypothetical protein
MAVSIMARRPPTQDGLQRGQERPVEAGTLHGSMLRCLGNAAAVSGLTPKAWPGSDLDANRFGDAPPWGGAEAARPGSRHPGTGERR